MARTEVLIAGAGPTGLVLAIWLKRLGVSVRIVDRAAKPGTTSRALAVQARTLELYDQIGLAKEAVKRGLKFAGVNLWANGAKAVRIPLGDIGEGLSPFPYVLILPQDEHERMLTDRLRALGVEVERPVELLGVEAIEGGVRARLKRPGGSEEICEAAYLAGCDGARSAVRESLGIGFPGGTYDQLFYVADVKATGPVMDRELHIALDQSEFLGVFPLKPVGAARLIGMVPRELRGAPETAGWADVSRRALERMKIEVQQVNWFSTYHVHHRVAERFREGRIFLLGDAAHIHSPVGGQGMNTGIGDAVNLGWKLAAVVQGRADEALLDSYNPERIAFAHRLVQTTDRVFTIATSSAPLVRGLREQIAARLVPAVAHARIARLFLFKTVSQIGVNYRKGPLAQGGAGRIVGGDRLPWAGPDSGPAGGDNFTPLASLDWQVHVYGEPSLELEEACAALNLALRAFIWRPAFWRAGLMRDASYLIRPDGYVAMADPNASPQTLRRFMGTLAFQMRVEPAASPAKAARKPAPRKRSVKTAGRPKPTRARTKSPPKGSA